VALVRTFAQLRWHSGLKPLYTRGKGGAKGKRGVCVFTIAHQARGSGSGKPSAIVDQEGMDAQGARCCAGAKPPDAL